jgi:hypothetical protein
METCNDCTNFQIVCKHETKKSVLVGQCIEFSTPEESNTKACYMFDNGGVLHDHRFRGAKTKEEIFVKHIENHLNEMGEGLKVACKICNKTIDEIYKMRIVKEK